MPEFFVALIQVVHYPHLCPETQCNKAMSSSLGHNKTIVMSAFTTRKTLVMPIIQAIVAPTIWVTHCSWWMWIVIPTSLTILLFFMTQLVTAAKSTAVLRKSGLKEPPVLPYSIPLLGHTFYFMWDVFTLFTSVT